MSSKAGESCIFAAFTAFFSVKVISDRLYLDKFDISKRHLVNIFCFVMLIIPFPGFESYCSKKCKKWRQSIIH